jgi:hypothetical protein
MRYAVSVDGTQVAQTTATSTRVPAALTNGPHSWQVTGTNPAGQQTQAPPATVFVDTVAPTVTTKLNGPRVIASKLQIYVSYVDLPTAGEPPADASGIAKVVVLWGDGTTVRLGRGSHRSFHAYRRPGRYRVTVEVADRAGNVTRVITHVKVTTPKPKKNAGKPSAKAKGK